MPAVITFCVFPIKAITLIRHRIDILNKIVIIVFI